MGTKFAETVFKDPSSKERTKIGILRRVLSGPFSSRKVKTLVNDKLGKVDYPKMQEQQVNLTTKAVLNLVQNTETLRQKESLPVLGNSCNTVKTWEAAQMLKKELGLCDVGKEDSVHITKYLKKMGSHHHRESIVR